MKTKSSKALYVIISMTKSKDAWLIYSALTSKYGKKFDVKGNDVLTSDDKLAPIAKGFAHGFIEALNVMANAN